MRIGRKLRVKPPLIKGETFSNVWTILPSDFLIDLWKLYNLFTGSVKGSYIDSFLQPNVESQSFFNIISGRIYIKNRHIIVSNSTIVVFKNWYCFSSLIFMS
ncbi:MAG: DUF3871 family protein [Bacteroidales bacterium]|nr:DUF3871 family protein [Bacteroidales bacterium]